MNEENVTLSLDDLFQISSGTDRDGLPVSSASVTLTHEDDDPDDEQQLMKNTVYLTNAILTYFADSGCTVAQLDIPVSSMKEFRDASEMIAEWYENFMYKGIRDTHLALVSVPVMLEGRIFMSLMDPVYYMGIPYENGARLIMCFSTATLDIAADNDVSMADIEHDIQAQIAAEKRKVDDELNQAYSEYEKEKAESGEFGNIYEQHVMDEYMGAGSEEPEEENSNESGGEAS